MSRMILVTKSWNPTVKNQPIHWRNNNKGKWHKNVVDIHPSHKKGQHLTVGRVSNRMGVSIDELLGPDSKHGVKFVDRDGKTTDPNSAVQEAYPHHSLSGAGEDDSSSQSSSTEDTSTSDSGSAQAPDDPGQTKLTDFGLKTKMLKSHALGLTAAWDFLLKALPQSFFAGESGIPQIRREKFDNLVAEGMAPAQAKSIVAAMFGGEMAAEYNRDAPYRGEGIPEKDTVQQITPPVPARMRADLELQAARRQGEEARRHMSPKTRRTFEEQEQM